MASSSGNRGGLSRRGFLLGAGAGLAAGLCSRFLPGSSFTGRTREDPRPESGMPGPYPGRVIEVRHPEAVGDDNEINPHSVRAMMNHGMCELTGADHAVEAWRKLFNSSDVVGIKVNPVGRRRSWNPRAVPAVSSPAVLLEIVAGLRSAGVHPRNIVLFERYAQEFIEGGYEKLMREPALDGVRWAAAAWDSTGGQLDIEGYDNPDAPRLPQIVGYDPDHYVEMGFCDPDPNVHHPKDDRRFRSHLSLVVSRMVNKFITIPVLKDHRSAGVTLALKNLSHGLNNNVARSHIGTTLSGGVAGGHRRTSGPNQCNTFIPACVNQPLTRQKATLHILDGLIGVYEGGPGAWNPSWGTWRRKSLFFATDPVAMDHVGWDIIDAKRVEHGWAPVGRMGLHQESPSTVLARHLAGLSGRGPLDPLSLGMSAAHFDAARRSEIFDRRQPEHIVLAGSIGLGVFEANRIDYRAQTWDAESNVWQGAVGKRHA